MFEDLARIIQGRVDPAVWTGISALTDAFEKHTATLWKDRITNLVMVGDSQDTGALNDKVMGILLDQAEALLQQMLIRLNVEEMRLSDLADLIEAMLMKPSDQDNEVLAALMASDDAVSAYCEAMAIKLGKAPEDLMEYVVQVSDMTIATMKNLMAKSVDQQQYSEEDNKIVLGLLNKHQTLIPDGVVSVAMEALGEGMPVGVDMSLLFNRFGPELLDKPVEQVVDHILSLAILARTPIDSVEEEAMFFLEQIYPEIFDLQKARKCLMARLNGLGEF